ncbi:MAG: hypothetical protein QOC94_2315 [Actinoplanes sp.]|jgi:hypothetical protein|nr:hypothetical protein [Actinoplanes sp.]
MAALVSSLVAAALAASSVSWSTANSVATGDQDGPAVAGNRSGRVAVVWEDDRDATDPADDNHSEVFLRVFQDGAPVFEKKLSAGGTSGTNWKHITPDVGLDDRGDAVVVWAEDPDGNGVFNIAYRVVSPTGSILASATANANAAGDQIVPKVAVDPDGTPGNATAVAFTVVWEDVQGSAHTVRAAGFTGATARAYEIVASQTTGTHHHPDVAVAASGDATVVWEEDADGNASFNIGLVRLAKATGAAVLARRLADASTAGQQRRPAVAENFAGDFVVAWESDHTGSNAVWARSFTAGAVPRHPEVQASSGTGAAAPSVGLDDAAAVVVGWTAGGQDGWLRGLNPDGTAAGRVAPQTFTQTTTGRQDQFAVAVSPWDELTVCYTDDTDGNGSDQVMLGTGGTGSADSATDVLARFRAAAA